MAKNMSDPFETEILHRELAFPGLHKKVLGLFENLEPGLVFDGAAGNGILAEKLIERGFAVIVTDLKIRENLRPNLRFFQSDLNRDLACRSESFDYCLCLETIEHLENPWHFLREISRIIKPGGRLILSTPNIDYLTCKLCFLFKGNFYPFFGRWQYEVIGHLTPLSRYYLDRILERNGFRIEKISYNRYRIPFLKMASPVKHPIFGESLIVQAGKI